MAGQVADGLFRTVSESEAHPGDRAGQPNGRGRQRWSLVKARGGCGRRSRRNRDGSDVGAGPVGEAEWADAETQRVAKRSLARTLEGRQSPRKERAAVDWQRSGAATDLPAEQRLEVEGRRASQCLRTSGSAEAQRRGGNGRQ